MATAVPPLKIPPALSRSGMTVRRRAGRRLTALTTTFRCGYQGSPRSREPWSSWKQTKMVRQCLFRTDRRACLVPFHLSRLSPSRIISSQFHHSRRECSLQSFRTHQMLILPDSRPPPLCPLEKPKARSGNLLPRSSLLSSQCRRTQRPLQVSQKARRSKVIPRTRASLLLKRSLLCVGGGTSQ